MSEDVLFIPGPMADASCTGGGALASGLEMRAAAVASALTDLADMKARMLSGSDDLWQTRDSTADAIADLAEIVRALCAEVSVS